jgi:hypothetical protein
MVNVSVAPSVPFTILYATYSPRTMASSSSSCHPPRAFTEGVVPCDPLEQIATSMFPLVLAAGRLTTCDVAAVLMAVSTGVPTTAGAAMAYAATVRLRSSSPMESVTVSPVSGERVTAMASEPRNTPAVM